MLVFPDIFINNDPQLQFFVFSSCLIPYNKIQRVIRWFHDKHLLNIQLFFKLFSWKDSLPFKYFYEFRISVFIFLNVFYVF